MNEKDEAFEEITVPTTETVAAPLGTGSSAVESAVDAANFDDGIVGKIGKYRWMICALLFFATTINYIDRQVLGILATDDAFKAQIGWNEAEYGFVNTAFQAAYAIGLLVVGNLMDRFGTRKGFSFAIVFWSVAAMCHSFARSAFGFGAARFALGLGEAGNFPAAIKTVAEWFPKKERAFATGVFNSGSNVGAILAPLSVPFIAVNYGWQWAFIITGAFGFIWLAFWLMIYRKPEEHPKLSKAELAYIQLGQRTADEKNTVGKTASAPANVGFCHREIFDRSDLVGLSFLAAEIFECEIRFEYFAARSAVDRDLCNRRCRLDRRRMAFIEINQKRLVGQCRAEKRRC